MFAQFLDIIFKSIKLDKNLYKNPKYFGEAAIYFAGLIMILDGIAGAVAANTMVKASIGVSGLTAILTWFVLKGGPTVSTLIFPGKLQLTTGDASVSP